MGEGEILEQRRSLAAPLILFLVIVFQSAAKWLQHLKKGASKTDKAIQLRGEIMQLLQDAGSFSQPSTFAQAAKLKEDGSGQEEGRNLQIVVLGVLGEAYSLFTGKFYK